MKIEFQEIPVGKYFRCNGNVYFKKSSRTAYLMPQGEMFFYFSKKQLCSPIAQTEEARIALVKSIAAWEEKLQETNPFNISVGSNACPLCALFFQAYTNCNGCPVKTVTGKHICADTPYRDAAIELDAWRNNRATQAAFREAAQKEVDFLKSINL